MNKFLTNRLTFLGYTVRCSGVWWANSCFYGGWPNLFTYVLRRLGGKDRCFPLLLYVWDGAGGQKVWGSLPPLLCVGNSCFRATVIPEIIYSNICVLLQEMGQAHSWIQILLSCLLQPRYPISVGRYRSILGSHGQLLFPPQKVSYNN